MTKTMTQDQALHLLAAKRELLGRGLSYVEKILFLHEQETSLKRPLIRGRDPIKLVPDRVLMQDATAQMAMLQFIQAGRKKTHVPATIHCDHLLRADKGAEPDLRKALTTNREVYDFLSSAAAKYGLGFWGPGSGMMHQVIFENYAFPGGLMIGTDSHTPNAGGLGALAIGVGGADAAEVMAGLPWETTHPYLVGVSLTGQLTGWASAKDVIFEMLRRFTVKGGTGKILEYFGPGAQTLSATEKATITNMGAELGATTSVFVYDDSMNAYLKSVGRIKESEQAESMAALLTQDEVCARDPEVVFDEIVEIDLGDIKPAHAGPYTPDRITSVADFRALIESEKWPEQVSVVLLGSCTNSSYSDLYAASQVLDQAAQHGLKPKAPLMFSPGSTRIYETLKRDGILDKLIQAGATILSASCGPCIGQWDRKDIEKGVSNCLFTTFNRNFRGRNDANPETKAFLTSAHMAAALAVSGDSGFNPETDTLTDPEGHDFKLVPPNPPPLPPGGLSDFKGTFVPPNENKSHMDVVIDPRSERLEFLKPFPGWDGNDFVDLPVLIKTKGKTTTDHISPGGKWLRFRGHLTNISRNMLLGAMNAFTGETGTATNTITGEKNIRIFDLADFYKENTGGFVIIGDENYGEGSSREHAAMSPRFMGARAVIAKSFARIHEANLKKQGVLPLTFSNPTDYDRIEEYDRLSIVDLAMLQPGQSVRTVIKKKDGTTHEIDLHHTLTRDQIEWFKAGSALNSLQQ
ncbi:MAG: aconitate hydratase [Desulfatiglans sp.]|jgi:aconitate hydratase|nr:aconitate hydratase [Thermodesulfobacteriota bacterium]MEE4354767.1 aconitate hydratase [Desulfatiglans sp.]